MTLLVYLTITEISDCKVVIKVASINKKAPVLARTGVTKHEIEKSFTVWIDDASIL